MAFLLILVSLGGVDGSGRMVSSWRYVVSYVVPFGGGGELTIGSSRLRVVVVRLELGSTPHSCCCRGCR